MATLERLDELLNGPKRPASLNELRGQRAELVERMQRLLEGAERRNTDLNEKQALEFRQLDQKVEELTERITEKEKSEAADAVASSYERLGQGDQEHWSERAAMAIRSMSTENRAVVSGSVDIPRLVSPDVISIPRNPRRLIDILVNRERLDGNAFEYIRQTVQTDNAAPVADGVEKPTSVYTVESVEDRARVVAHLSQPAPVRIFADHRNVRQWIEREMAQGVLGALEGQIVSGDGTGEQFTGILETSGTTSVAFATDRVTSIRKGRTALDNLHEDPTAIAMHPDDAEAIDLVREGSDGGFLSQASDLDPVFGGLRRIITTSVPAGTAILADWNQSRIYVREDVRLDIDTGGALFDRNQVKLRAEGRFGFAVLRPQAFAIVALESAG